MGDRHSCLTQSEHWPSWLTALECAVCAHVLFFFFHNKILNLEHFES